MKRLTWILLALFCTALVQVQPVDASKAKGMACACCHPGTCEMPGCCPAPAPAALSSAQSARVANLPVVRDALAPDRAETFYASFVEPATVRCRLVAPLQFPDLRTGP
jgi:hypothetical protein